LPGCFGREFSLVCVVFSYYLKINYPTRQLGNSRLIVVIVVVVVIVVIVVSLLDRLLSRILSRFIYSRRLPLALEDVAQVALAVTAALPDDCEQRADAANDERGGSRELVDCEVL